MRIYKLLFTSLFLVFCTWGCAQTIVNNDSKAVSILKAMSLQEKVGQMTQININVISKTLADSTLQDPHQIDIEKLNTAIDKYHIGSVLNAGATAFSREHWFDIISAIQKKALAARHKIPVLYGIDAIHGTTYTTGATLFPQQLALAATFNTDLAYQTGEITAYETRASYIPWNFSPVLDLGKNALWPRIWETFGEDPYLVSQMGAGMIRGYQGNNISSPYKVAACMKHFLGYSAPLSGKDRTPAWIPDRYLREYFLPSFREAVKQQAKTVMINSADINGIPVHSSKYILTQLLRNELKFKGVAVTDWGDIVYLHTRHHIAANVKEAVMMAVNAGIDMSMVPDDFSFCQYLIELVNEGKVSIERINEAVLRILKLKLELGLFEKAVGDPKMYTKFGSAEFQQASYLAATEAVTLLKNQNHVLPLKKGQKILVTGPAANTMRALNGGWSYTWQGLRTDEFTTGKKTILKALIDRGGAENVKYIPGSSYDKTNDLDKAVDAAANSDVILLCLGEDTYTESPGNINDLNLPQAQIELANAMIKTGKPVILLLAEGRPRIITSVDSTVAATVMAYLPGNEGGRAIASVLYGDVNPSGKLPITYPRASNALVNYYRKNTENGNKEDLAGYKPLYEFGSGLSYTNYQYDVIKAEGNRLTPTTTLKLKIRVTNTGSYTGKESVLLYTRDYYASISPDYKRLRKFKKVSLKPGESKEVEFELTPADLQFIGEDGLPTIEKGDFEVMIGSQKFQFSYDAAPVKPVGLRKP